MQPLTVFTNRTQLVLAKTWTDANPSLRTAAEDAHCSSACGKQQGAPSKNQKQNSHMIQQSHLWFYT